MRSRLRLWVAQIRSRVTTPLFQVILALGGMVFGAWIVGTLALGLTIIVASLLVFADGFYRQPVPKDLRELSAHEAVLERQRRAP